jgi:pimeloyl-ACP methyl ester carboxylesterase
VVVHLPRHCSHFAQQLSVRGARSAWLRSIPRRIQLRLHRARACTRHCDIHARSEPRRCRTAGAFAKRSHWLTRGRAHARASCRINRRQHVRLGTGWLPANRRMLALSSSPLFGLADIAFNATLWYFRLRGANRRLSAAEVAAYYGPFKRWSSRVAHQRTTASVLDNALLLEVERATQRLAGLPTLILFSDDDARRTQGLVGVPSWTERHARTFPNHRLFILPRTRHFPQEDAPDTMAVAIDDWHRGSVQDEPSPAVL